MRSAQTKGTAPLTDSHVVMLGVVKEKAVLIDGDKISKIVTHADLVVIQAVALQFLSDHDKIFTWNCTDNMLNIFGS